LEIGRLIIKYNREVFMLKRLFLIIMLAFFINYIFGCTHAVKKDITEIKPEKDKIAEVVLVDGNVIKFDNTGGKYDPERNAVMGVDNKNKYQVIPVEDILYVKISKMSTVATVLIVTAMVGLFAAIIVAATSGDSEPRHTSGSDIQSCPFIYSYDGKKYYFDAEPLGGAICKGLERIDYSQMEHLKSAEEKYNIMVSNEMEETQYLDELKLAVVDHDPSQQPVADWFGNMYLVSDQVSPVSAIDENGKDLMKFLGENDDVHWQTQLPRDDSFLQEDTRHHITVKFPKPTDAETANLIVNSGTALWGSNMIKEMLQAYGSGIDAWYDDVNSHGPKLWEMLQFHVREELYMLKVHIKNGDNWIESGMIPGGGPLVTETRLVELDVSEIPGDSLILRIDPPRGFWTLDYMAVNYNEKIPAEVNELKIGEAKDMAGKDISALLTKTDGNYFIMPEINQWAMLSFDAPEEHPGKIRSVFLKSYGYYEIHIDKTGPEQKELISKVLSTPGEIVRYALNQYFISYGHLYEN
jgi:hypothetical protein